MAKKEGEITEKDQNEGISEKTKINFSLQYFITVIGFVVVMVGGYYDIVSDLEATKKELADIEKKVADINQTLKENNLTVINYKLEELKIMLKDFINEQKKNK